MASSLPPVPENETALLDENELAQMTLESIGEAVITTDAAGKVTYLNQAAEKIIGWSNAEARGQPLWAILSLVNETTREAVENPVDRALSEGTIVGLPEHTLLTRRDGAEFAIDDSAAPIRDRGGKIVGGVLVFHDVTEQRTLARQITHQASHDALTGLVNRAEFEHRLKRVLASHQQDSSEHALCYLDLDQFKVVNDTCGHVAGDALLRQIGGLLLQRLRQRDTLARLGGDEFGVLLERCPPHQALRIANELRKTIRDFRFVWEGKPFTIGVSIGLVMLAEAGHTPADVMRAADAACYAAKEQGRDRVHVYQPDDAELAQRSGEMQWVSRLVKAMEEDRIRMFYQSVLPAAPENGEAAYHEVLMRLYDEQDKLIAPGAFIPAAERYNLIPALDRWVISHVLAWQSAQLNADGMPPVCGINLSGVTISDPHLLDFIGRELKAHKVPPQALCFEITETAAVAHFTHAASFIEELKKLGCRFALDDFGSGMSSFAYLKNLPVDFLKIDGHFVRDIHTSPVDLAMVEAINRVGHVMGIKTIAESVESQAILEKLREVGVDYVQGYGLSQPRPLEELTLGAGREDKVLNAKS